MTQEISSLLEALDQMTDREISEHFAKRLVGARGNGVSGIRRNRRRGKVWINFEVTFELPAAQEPPA